MTPFDELVSASPWRTTLLIATVDGVRLWELSDGDIEWVLPDHYTADDVRRLSAWLQADTAAKAAGQPSPSYRDYMRPDAPRVPMTADEMAVMIGWPPDGVNLHEVLDACQGEIQ